MSNLDIKFFYYFYMRFLSLRIRPWVGRLCLRVQRCPAHCRTSGSIPGLHPLAASAHTPQVVTIRMASDILLCLLGGPNWLGLRTAPLSIFVYLCISPSTARENTYLDFQGMHKF